MTESPPPAPEPPVAAETGHDRDLRSLEELELELAELHRELDGLETDAQPDTAGPGPRP